MFCINCGKEIEDNSLFCSHCGSEQGPATTTENPVENLFHTVFSSNNFHLATVFYLVYVCASAIATLISGEMPLPVIEIFIIISLFKLQNLAKSKSPLLSFASPLKTFRIIINIYRVLIWILVGIFAVCGIILTAAGGIAGFGLSEMLEEILNEADMSLYGETLLTLGGTAITAMGILFIIVAVACALFNVFMYGSLYKSAKSAEWTAGTGNYMFEKLNSTRGWLIFSIVMNCISVIRYIGSINVLNLISAGFNIAFLVLIINCIDQIKNSRQIENL